MGIIHAITCVCVCVCVSDGCLSLSLSLSLCKMGIIHAIAGSYEANRLARTVSQVMTFFSFSFTPEAARHTDFGQQGLKS
jgi:hypothetical protein